MNKSKFNAMFPNGFESWHETHYNVIEHMEHNLLNDQHPLTIHYESGNLGGMGGKWELAKEITNKFEQRNRNRVWDGEFIDEIEIFIDDIITKF